MMQLYSNVSVEDGHRNLGRIIKEVGNEHVDWNEANTRFHMIDRLLVECLGWPKAPRHAQGGRTYRWRFPGLCAWFTCIDRVGGKALGNIFRFSRRRS